MTKEEVLEREIARLTALVNHWHTQHDAEFELRHKEIARLTAELQECLLANNAKEMKILKLRAALGAIFEETDLDAAQVIARNALANEQKP